MNKLTYIFLSLLFFTLTISIAGQNPVPSATPPDEEDTIKISTTLIQVDVTVTDEDGNIVKDLKPEDFEVYENGKKQDITNFSFINSGAANTPPEQTARSKNDREKNVSPIPSAKLKAEQVRRTYALVVDDLGLSFSSTLWVKEALKKFVNEQMQPGDLVAIVRTGKGLGALQSFTSDKRQLMTAIEKLKWNSNGRGGIGAFEPLRTDSVQKSQSERDFNKQIENTRNENFSIGTLGALNYIIKGMGKLPGRKAVMLFSEGFTVKFTRSLTGGTPSRLLSDMRVLADRANRSSVVLYTLDPRGLVEPSTLSADDDAPDLFDADTIQNRDDRVSNFVDTQQTLRYLAYQTGGIPFINQNNLNKGLQKAIDDQSSYYLLGYEPDETTFDPNKSKFNSLKVKLLRPGLKIRYRSGFFGVTDEKIKNSVAATPQQKLFEALTSPFGDNGVNLRFYPVYQNDAKLGDVIQALVHIDANDLKFTQANGNQIASFEIVAMTFGDNGAPIDQAASNYTIAVSDKIYRNMLANGFVYRITVPIKKAGPYQFRVAVRDKNTDKIGAASQFLEVPSFKKGMSVSGLILDNFTEEEWKKVTLENSGSGETSQKSVLVDTSLRQFKSGTVVRYDYVIYNPKQSGSLKTQMRLIQDGKVIYEEQPQPVKTAGQTDLLRLQAAGAFSFGKNFPPGDYILQIIATDETDAKKTASQFVELEIVE